MNQNIIFYFSGTGNSLKIAKDIAGALKNCKLVSMGKPYTQTGTYNRIGFVFPTYAMGPPPAVEDFIRRLDLSESRNAYFFAIATCGMTAGVCLPRINRILGMKGLRLQYGKQIKMFSNYVAMYDMAKDPDKKAKEAAVALEPIIKEIISNAASPPPMSNPFLGFIHNAIVVAYPRKDKGFRISEKCRSCGTCTKICPVGNIKLERGKPVYKRNCQRCMACIQWCPERAIDYKKKTAKRGRYHHPDITLDNMTGRVKIN